jgi:uncharacterized protein YydD (DUF2326 family)
MDKERLESLANRLLEIPAKVVEAQLELLTLTETSQSQSEKITQIESVIRAEIGATVDGAGKKAYSNAEARDAAFVEKTADNYELIVAKTDLAKTQRSVQEKRIKIEALGNEQRNIRSVLYFISGGEGAI